MEAQTAGCCVRQVTAQNEHVGVASDQGAHSSVRVSPTGPPAPAGSRFLSCGALLSTVQGRSGPLTRRLQGAWPGSGGDARGNSGAGVQDDLQV